MKKQMQSEFTTPEIEKSLHIRRDRMKEWIKKGYIVPSVQKGAGRGTKHIFSRDDVYAVFLYRELIEQGISRKLAGGVVYRFFYEFYTFTGALKENLRYLVFTRWKSPGEKPFTDGQLISAIFEDMPTTMQYCLFFNLMNIKEEVDRMLG